MFMLTGTCLWYTIPRSGPTLHLGCLSGVDIVYFGVRRPATTVAAVVQCCRHVQSMHVEHNIRTNELMLHQIHNMPFKLYQLRYEHRGSMYAKAQVLHRLCMIS